jgi:hypothetical protein
VSETFSIHLDQITDAVRAAIPAAGFKAMEHVHQVAVDRTPLRDGNLRGGSHVDATPDGAIIRYEGPYARYQHFELLKHTEGQRLYLQTAVVQETPKALEIVAEELRKVIESP